MCIRDRILGIEIKDDIYKNLLPPLSILDDLDEKELIRNLEKLDFSIKSLEAA